MSSPHVEQECSSPEPQAEQCPICLDSITQSFETACHHCFCSDCLMTWLKESNACPLCRCELDEQEDEPDDEEDAIRSYIHDYRSMELNFTNIPEEDLINALLHLENLDLELSQRAYHSPSEIKPGSLMPFVMAAILLANRQVLLGTLEGEPLGLEAWQTVANAMHDTVLKAEGVWITGSELRRRLLEAVVTCNMGGDGTLPERSFQHAIDRVLDTIVYVFWHGRRWFAP